MKYLLRTGHVFSFPFNLTYPLKIIVCVSPPTRSAFDPLNHRIRSWHGSLPRPFFNILSHRANEDLHLPAKEWMGEIRIRHMPLASNEVLHAEQIRARCGEIARQSGKWQRKCANWAYTSWNTIITTLAPGFPAHRDDEEEKTTKRDS